MSSWICMKALLLQRTSQQGEIELPPESTKPKSESDFWRHFRVSCHARWETKSLYFVAHIYTFLFQLCGLFDAGSQSQNTVYTLHCFMLGIYCMTVSRSSKGKRVLTNPRNKRLRHINNLRKRRLGTIMLRLQNDLQSRYFLWPLYLVAHIYTFLFQLCGFIWRREPVTKYGLHSSLFYAWYLLYDCEPVLEGEAGFDKSPEQEVAAHKQFTQKETGHYYASLAKRLAKQIFLMTTAPKSFLK